MTNTKIVLALAIGLAASAVAGQAAVISSSATPNPISAPTEWTSDLKFKTFNTALGTLDKVVVTVNTSLFGDIYGFNPLTTPITVNYSYSLNLLATDPVYSALNLSSSSSGSLFLPGLVMTTVPFNLSQTASTTFIPLIPGYFFGDGISTFPIQFHAFANFAGSGGGNVAFGASTSGSVSGQIDYYYSSVPEPTTYIAGLGALCLFGMSILPKRKVS